MEKAGVFPTTSHPCCSLRVRQSRTLPGIQAGVNDRSMALHKGNWLLLILSVSLTLLLAEAAMRFSGAVQMQPRFQCFDAVVGKVYCDSTQGPFSRAEYTNYLVINSDGMADREYPLAKPAGTVRIALLGDSFTASEYLPAEEKFEGLLERELSEQLGKPVEVLNFGISAIETWNQLQIFHLKAVHYQPDITFLVFFWGNDIRDNIEQLRTGSPNPLRDEYKAPLIRRLKASRKNFNRALWNHSMLYQVARTGYGRFEQSIEDLFKPGYLDHIDRMIAGDQDGGRRSDPQPGDFLVADTEFNDDDAFFWDSDGWDITRRLLLRLREETVAGGSRLAVLHFPSEGLARSPVPLPHEAFDAFLETHGIPHVSLFPDYRDLPDDELRRHFIQGDGHWTPHGHRYVASRTQDMLIQALAD